MFYSDNPLADFERHDAEQERQLEQLPICADCGEHIQGDHYYLIENYCICSDCLESNYRIEMERYM